MISSIIIFKDRLRWIILALNGTSVSFLPQFESDRRALLYWNKLTSRNNSNKLANRNNRKRLWLECFFDIFSFNHFFWIYYLWSWTTYKVLFFAYSFHIKSGIYFFSPIVLSKGKRPVNLHPLFLFWKHGFVTLYFKKGQAAFSLFE